MTNPPRQPDPPPANQSTSWTLPPAPHASALARDHLRRHAAHLDPEVLAAALIATSELIANAVQHGQPEITLGITVEASALRVVVTDTGPDLPITNAQPPPPDSAHGRGLFIVHSLVSAWGVQQLEHGHGKTVWFQMALA